MMLKMTSPLFLSQGVASLQMQKPLFSSVRSLVYQQGKFTVNRNVFFQFFQRRVLNCQRAHFWSVKPRMKAEKKKQFSVFFICLSISIYLSYNTATIHSGSFLVISGRLKLLMMAECRAWMGNMKQESALGSFQASSTLLTCSSIKSPFMADLRMSRLSLSQLALAALVFRALEYSSFILSYCSLSASACSCFAFSESAFFRQVQVRKEKKYSWNLVLSEVEPLYLLRQQLQRRQYLMMSECLEFLLAGRMRDSPSFYVLRRETRMLESSLLMRVMRGWWSGMTKVGSSSRGPQLHQSDPIEEVTQKIIFRHLSLNKFKRRII